MNKRQKKKIKRILYDIIYISIATLLIFLLNYFGLFEKQNNINISTIDIKEIRNIDINNDKLNMFFLYVGQADCTFIKLNEKTMLIDSGNNQDGSNIVFFLNELNISKIDYLVGTHSDEDHIGGIDDIILNFDIEKFLIPKRGEGEINYSNAIKAAKEKNTNIINPKEGETFDFGDASIEILSALNNEEINDNNTSIVIELKYKDTRYLFMGDAEKEVENSKTWEKVDVLKVGHHGSNTSSTQDFLNQVKPIYSIISVGKDNKYRLPNNKVLERLNNINTKILRTDINCSSFWLTSDGNEIDISEININLDGNDGGK